MKNQIELRWEKEDDSLPNHTHYVAFAEGVGMDYKIAINDKSGDVYLGVLQTDVDILKTHAIVYPSYPMMNDNTIFHFVQISDKIRLVIEAGKTPNAGTINGSEVEIHAIDIAKKMAQNMFNQKVKSFFGMMKVCNVINSKLNQQ